MSRINLLVFVFILLGCIYTPLYLHAQCEQIRGTFTTTVGSSVSYSYCYSSGTFFSAQWTATLGTITSTSLSPDGTTAYATVQWTSPGTGTIRIRDGAILETRNVTISCAVGNPSFSPSSPSVCGSGSISLTATTGSQGTTVRWYNAITGGTLLTTGGSYTTPVLSSTTTYYISSYNSTTGCESSPRVAVTVGVNAIPAQPAVINATICIGKTATLSATPGSGGQEVQWFAASTGGTALATGSTFVTPALTASTTYYAATRNTTSNCSSTRVAVTATVVSPPGDALGGNYEEVIYGSGSLSIQVPAGSGGSTVRWYTDETTSTVLYEGTTFATPTLTQSKTYYVSTYSASLSCESAQRTPVVVTVVPLITPSNMKEEIIRVEGIQQDNQIYSLTATQKSSVMSYYDGLLRTHQQVVVKGSPNGYDVVQPVEFDALGRSSKRYLPYVANTTNGTLHSTFKADQELFYATANDKIANDANPYAVSSFENSPLGRVLEQGDFGQDWQPGTTHTSRFAYSYNTGSTTSGAEDVRILKSDGSSSAFYGANVLVRSEVTDANGNKAIQFHDKWGRLLVSKDQLDETIDNVTVSYLETYYIYDDFGRIKYIVSPKGTADLKNNGWTWTQTFADKYAHQFVYDVRGRLIEKKVPGQGWLYYAYDNLNRLVLAQDGLLRAQNKWSFVKYDVKGRTVMTGLYLNATQTTRATIQTLLDGLYVTGNATYPETARYEDRGTTLHGYTNISFPKVNGNNTALEVLSVNYYESHDFDYNKSRDYKYDSATFAGQSTTSYWQARGLPTGSKRLVLGTTTWLYNYIFYDKYGRPIQVRSNNHLSTTIDNLQTMVYDFEGKVLSVKNYHSAGSGKITTVINRYEYDAQGRLVKIYQNNNSASTDQLVVQYVYNELGQLVDKKLHNTSGTSFLQSVDYRYNLQGQLQSINNAQLSINASTNDETDDFFGMEFLYNTVESGLSNSAYYNGNISAVKWKGAGAASGVADQKSYKYTYDKSYKLKTASSQATNGSGVWSNEVGALNETIAYDQNGNINSLQRNQRKHQLNGLVASYTAETIDNLSYAYNSAQADQLLKVEDGSTAAGFSNGNSGTNNDYTYDVNGNVLTDANKGISNTVYNILGKPVTVTFSDSRKIEYVYDASGNKLTMKAYNTSAQLESTTDYVNGFVYENAVLSYFGSPEGRVVKNGSTLDYQYAIADHQGNTRVVFTSTAPTADVKSTNFETTDAGGFLNYPTGGSRNGMELFDHTDFSGTTYTYSQLLNGGNNSQVGVARTYKVYPGDKVKIEAYAKYYNAQSNSSNIAGFAAALTQAFGVTAASTGEAAKAYQALNSYGGLVASGGGQGSSSFPKLFVNILLFDKDYNFLDIAFEQIDGGAQTGITPKAAHDYMSREYTVKEVGYAYVYISNESSTYVEGYFDDIVFTYTPTRVLQYNEYYPFGLQANSSWTRDNNQNVYLYNSGSELNKVAGWYETNFRGYDPAMGRFLQVDGLATVSHNQSVYQFAGNNPIMFNDPTGLTQEASNANAWDEEGFGNVNRGNGGGGAMIPVRLHGSVWEYARTGPGSGRHWTDHVATVERNAVMMSRSTFDNFYGIHSDEERREFWRKQGQQVTGYMTYVIGADGNIVGDIEITVDDVETTAYILGAQQQQVGAGNLVISFVPIEHGGYKGTAWDVSPANSLQDALRIAIDYRNKYGLQNLILLSHGRSNSLSLGDTKFSTHDLIWHTYNLADMISLFNTVNSGGTLLFYGCTAGRLLGPPLQEYARCDINTYMNTNFNVGISINDQRKNAVKMNGPITEPISRDYPGLLNLRDGSFTYDMIINSNGSFKPVNK